MSADSPIRVALFGNGFARTVILPCLRNVPEMSVVGIASPNLERAQATAREFGIEQVSADHRELLKSAKPELRHRERGDGSRGRGGAPERTR